MEGPTRPICVFCCHTFRAEDDSDKDEEDSISKAFSKFCSEVLSVRNARISLPRLPKNCSVCSDCLGLVKKATESREEVVEVEGRVRRLQWELLGELRELQRRMEWFQVYMRTMAGVVGKGDDRNKDVLLKTVSGGRARGRGGDDVVGVLRGKVLSVADNVAVFKKELCRKLLSENEGVVSHTPRKVTLKISSSDKKKEDVAGGLSEESDLEVKLEGEDPVSPASHLRDPLEISSSPENSPYPDDEIGGKKDTDDDDDEEFVPGEENEDEDNSNDAEDEWYPVSRKRLKLASDLHVDLTGMSNWRKSVVSRVLAKVRKRREDERWGRPIIDKRDVRTNYLMEYDQGSGYLKVGEVDDLKINDEEATLSCSKCDYSIGESVAKQDKRPEVFLFWHVLGHHLNAFNCDHCGKNFKSWNHFQTHRQSHEKPEAFTCDVCGREMCTRAALRQHKKKTHSKEGVANIVKKQEKGTTFECATCGKVFGNSARLKLHNERVHSEEQESGSRLTIMCPKCGKSFTKGGWEYHKQFVCVEGGEKAIQSKEGVREVTSNVKKQERCTSAQCDTCGKVFGNSTRLRLHNERVHSSEEEGSGSRSRLTVMCPKCGKSFTKGGWEYHKRFVCGEGGEKAIHSKLECEICMKTGKQRSTFKNAKMLKNCGAEGEAKGEGRIFPEGRRKPGFRKLKI